MPLPKEIDSPGGPCSGEVDGAKVFKENAKGLENSDGSDVRKDNATGVLFGQTRFIYGTGSTSSSTSAADAVVNSAPFDIAKIELSNSIREVVDLQNRQTSQLGSLQERITLLESRLLQRLDEVVHQMTAGRNVNGVRDRMDSDDVFSQFASSGGSAEHDLATIQSGRYPSNVVGGENKKAKSNSPNLKHDMHRFVVRDEYKEKEADKGRKTGAKLKSTESLNKSNSSVGVVTRGQTIVSTDDEEPLDTSTSSEKQATLTAKRQWWIVHPSSPYRMVWDVGGMILIAYDTVAIPLSLAFTLEEVAFTVAMFWVTLLFWTTDIACTFVTGYFNEDQLEVRPRQIAKHYLRSWFMMDVAVVSADWLVVAVGGTEGGSGLSFARTARAIRVLRSFRLLRLVKLKKILQDLQDRISSEYIVIMMNIVKLIIIIVLLGHLIACVWYAIGDSEANGWVSFFDLHSEPVEYRYLTSLHWALTQFTPATQDIKPCNSLERLIATVVLLCGLIINAFFISSITAAMARLRHLRSNANMQLSILRRYLRQRQVRWQLSVRVRKYCEFLLDHQNKQIMEKDVALLKTLSLPLQRSLAQHMHSPTLCRHPFFLEYANVDLTAFQKLCHLGLSTVILSKSDILFSEGEIANRMYFVGKGTLQYQFLPQWNNYSEGSTASQSCGTRSTMSARTIGSDNGGPPMQLELLQHQWCCESVMWVPWNHVGTLGAKTVCELFAVSAEEFANVTKAHKIVQRSSVKYANLFVNALNKLNALKMTDLFPQDEDEVRSIIRGYDETQSQSVDPSKSVHSTGFQHKAEGLIRKFRKSVVGEGGLHGHGHGH